MRIDLAHPIKFYDDIERKKEKEEKENNDDDEDKDEDEDEDEDENEDEDDGAALSFQRLCPVIPELLS
ncbi:hypothetical protein V1477_009193 [Vespula maculifrons]|uniref:Uncharacterized protein n=1 Tax=Vespula maculifrons TaxID=7453 RepID=A0ABD2CC20_VESMC